MIRSKVAGHQDLANKFDPRIHRALGTGLMIFVTLNSIWLNLVFIFGIQYVLG
jgi:hypothetical protein